MPDPKETERLLRLHNELDNLPSSPELVAQKNAIKEILYNGHDVANVQRAQTDLGLRDERGRLLNWYGNDPKIDSAIAALEGEM
jgi:hypothetical protein